MARTSQAPSERPPSREWPTDSAPTEDDRVGTVPAVVPPRESSGDGDEEASIARPARATASSRRPPCRTRHRRGSPRRRHPAGCSRRTHRRRARARTRIARGPSAERPCARELWRSAPSWCFRVDASVSASEPDMPVSDESDLRSQRSRRDDARCRLAIRKPHPAQARRARVVRCDRPETMCGSCLRSGWLSRSRTCFRTGSFT